MEAVKQKRRYFHQLLIRLGEERHKEIIVESEFGVTSTSQLNEEQVDRLIRAAESRLSRQGRLLKESRSKEQKHLKNWRNKCLLVLNERGIVATPKDWSAINNELSKKQYQWVMPDNGIINRKGLFAFRTVDDLKILFKQLCAIRDNEKKAAIKIKDLTLKN
ncbi:hypothetical protein [Labilibaculum euxinus]